MQEIAPGIFAETGFQRINVGAILTDDGWVLIDTPPYPEDAHRWREMLQSVSDAPFCAIVTTDCHRDRFLGNCWFDAHVIAAHAETINHIRSLPSAFVDSAIEALAQDVVERHQFSSVRLRLPTVSFTRRMQLRYGGREIPLLAMPGPTAGSLWVHLPEHGVLFAGDSIVVNQHLYISSSSTKDWLENMTNLRRSRFAAEIIVPGRGPLTGKAATEPVSNYLRLARRRVYSLYRAGRPRADTSSLVPELLPMFPYQEHELERVQRRIKAGLDRIYEEFKLSDRLTETGAR
ncbi:MAG: MBL fold metallo-hydrolase [Anaerolineae bacterium]|nr:MBL fold metallo-hydrolase [Anaerolineae bacterium]